MKTIAVIDDDVYIGDMLETVLRKEGYGVTRAYSGTEALYVLDKTAPDLVLLDLMLPGLNGEEVIKKISGTPVIVVSAKAAPDDKVKLLTGGAADYVTKPFDVKELLARISLRLKDGSTAGGILEFENIALDTRRYTVTVDGEELKLTRTEYAILKLLMRSPGIAVSKNYILDEIAADTPDCTDGSLKTHISNLRKKLFAAGGGNVIQSVWGIGFRLARDNECDIN